MSKRTAFGFSVHRKTQAVFLLWLILLGIQWTLFRSKQQHEQNIFELDAQLQQEIEERKHVSSSEKIYPFNPNFISDTRGYFLSLSTTEIDRLHSYRKKGKWINSAKDFQRVTGVSNKWMNLYAPYFKFPTYKYPSTKKRIPVKKNDLNTASVAELDFIKGIGKVLANRIIKYRQRINGYSTLDQLSEVYGLDAHVVEAIKEQFTIVQKSKIKKLDMNRASLFQLVEIPYLSKSEARRMISLRTEKGKISWDHLKAIKGFDSLKIKRLTLYLF